jgi:hypothetical protein
VTAAESTEEVTMQRHYAVTSQRGSIRLCLRETTAHACSDLAGVAQVAVVAV